MSQKPQTPPASISHGWLAAFIMRHSGLLAAALAFVYFGLFMLPQHDDPNDFHFHQFGRLPAIDGGRCKPMDTVARMDLMILTHRQQFYNADAGKTYPATKWFLDSATLPMPGLPPALAQAFQNGDRAALDYKVFRIENDQLLKMLNLEMRDGLRYSLVEILPAYRTLAAEARRLIGDEENGIEGKDPKNQTLVEAKTLELWQHLQLFWRLAEHSSPLVIPSANGNDQWKSFAFYMDEAASTAAQIAQLQQQLEAQNAAQQQEQAAATAAQIAQLQAQLDTFERYMTMLVAFSQGDKKEFNRTLDAQLDALKKRDPARMKAMDAEIFFNEFEPFYRCLEIYIVIALLAAGSWFATSWGPSMRRAAFAAMVVAFAFHTFALCMRMYLQGRPPITNLYSSAVFIGWGSVLLALISEAIYKNGIATVVGAVLGFATLIIAHLLSLDGDTMVMLQAVLDTNFWLATHVTCVSFGYVTVAVAGAMGAAYIILGIFTDKLRGEGSSDLARMTYGVLCTGMFFSFVGTVLGGLWADYSWGRFWGWDPKENGALLIVIWVALILHARWGGMVKQRGIAVLAVMGLTVVSWSWFGTNFLGVGLHAYGGAKGTAMLAMVLIDFLILALAVLGMVPLEHWQSFRVLPKTDAPPLPPVPPTAIKPKPAGA